MFRLGQISGKMRARELFAGRCLRHQVLRKSSGQSTFEFLIVSSLVLIIIFAFVSLWDGWRRNDITADSMLDRSLRQAPFTSHSSLGVSNQGIKDVLEH